MNSVAFPPAIGYNWGMKIRPPKPVVKKPVAQKVLCTHCAKPLVAGRRLRRGCCPRCHIWLWRKILAGEVTDEQLINIGSWLPKKKPGRKFKSKTQGK